MFIKSMNLLHLTLSLHDLRSILCFAAARRALLHIAWDFALDRWLRILRHRRALKALSAPNEIPCDAYGGKAKEMWSVCEADPYL